MANRAAAILRGAAPFRRGRGSFWARCGDGWDQWNNVEARGYGPARVLETHGMERGGASGRKEAETASAGPPPIQRFNLREDIGERWNVAAKYPEIVERLTRLLRDYVANGRSTPGPRRKNDRVVDIFNASTVGAAF